MQKQLAADMNCTVADLNGEKDSLVFVDYRENPGRRPFPRGSQHFELLLMGGAIIVSATPKIMQIVRPQLEGEGRDNAFAMPFVHGHTLYYLPDLSEIKTMPAPAGFEFELAGREQMAELYKTEGFKNALGYDLNHARPDVLAVCARHESRLVGIAGASADCEKMWQVGMDVLPEFRNRGLAAYIINRLTLEVLKLGLVPYYGTASSNIASQRVAHRAGYLPAWVCAYHGRFEGIDLMPTS